MFVNVEYQHLQIDVVYQHLQIEYGSNNFTGQSNEIPVYVSHLIITAPYIIKIIHLLKPSNSIILYTM